MTVFSFDLRIIQRPSRIYSCYWLWQFFVVFNSRAGRSVEGGSPYQARRSAHRRTKERRTTPPRRTESSIRRASRDTGNPSVANNEGCTPRLSNLPPSVIPPRTPWRRVQIRRPSFFRLPSPLRCSAPRRSLIRRSSRASIHLFQPGGQRPNDHERGSASDTPKTLGGGWTERSQSFLSARIVREGLWRDLARLLGFQDQE